MTTVAHDPSAQETLRATSAGEDRSEDVEGVTKRLDQTVVLSSPNQKVESSAHADDDAGDEGCVAALRRKRSSVASDDLPAPFLRVRSIEEVAAKKKVLLHDVDAGAPCLSCSDCPGFQLHVWRKICTHCRCPWENHDIFHEDDNEKETTVIYNEQGQSTRQQALQSLKTHLKQLSHTQNPVQDKEAHMCTSICDDETLFKFSRLNSRRMRDQRDSNVFPAHTHTLTGPCACCHQDIKPSDTATVAQVKTGEEQFHFNCFVCKQCREPIVGPGFYAYRLRHRQGVDDELQLCARCHAEKYLPRCAGCDELIFDPYFTQAEHRNWHQEHFCCHLCDVHLGGSQYTKTDSGEPVCIACYNTKLAPMCHACSKPIHTDQMLLEIGDRSFHGDPACFHCVTCGDHLYSEEKGGNGVLLNDRLYCRKHAAEATEALTVRCFVCSQEITENHIKRTAWIICSIWYAVMSRGREWNPSGSARLRSRA
ncbi:hypothetical protein PTSG_07306 [Salpingoeca rosetta]|uniref:LIM zinc-binding domain-containing protein n=1 Tax=Salpingoeca rosetta (strain ATCC 50818 / BSB-021) TaxID=946362 RepID=F2UJ15_SALR5|nr:uncharacterized protein PTSG_07306 [Salpingoeca rosetta]EGD76963.1 hypothetical protein PTSG_07306 [Salpingoeca rosetta]|eukprot:XP_004990803.1 hypothetical protein PTSG_07306 [Salpingoeca rosetta]